MVSEKGEISVAELMRLYGRNQDYPEIVEIVLRRSGEDVHECRHCEELEDIDAFLRFYESERRRVEETYRNAVEGVKNAERNEKLMGLAEMLSGLLVASLGVYEVVGLSNPADLMYVFSGLVIACGGYRAVVADHRAGLEKEENRYLGEMKELRKLEEVKGLVERFRGERSNFYN